MDTDTSGTGGLLDLVREEQARRKAQGPSHAILIRWNNNTKTDAEWDEAIAAKRRSGEFGTNTVVIPMPWYGPPLCKKLT